MAQVAERRARMARREEVSSRVLWAIGFHQPPAYYLAQQGLELPTGDQSR